MKRAVITLALFLACAAVAAGEQRGEVEYYRQLAEKQLAEMQTRPAPAYVYAADPVNFLTVAPQYFHARAGADDGTETRANGAALRATYSRALGDRLTLSLLYEFAAMKVDGEDDHWNAHTAGIGAEIALGVFGRILPSLARTFEHEADEDENTTSLTAWWEKDFAAGENWLLTPYAGWQSRYEDADARPANDTRNWTHFAAAGLKLGYRAGCLGLNLRAGLSRRLSDRDDGGYGYGARAFANGVAQYSHAANRDRTLGSVGAGITYAVGANASLGLDYDGFFGEDTSAHTGTLSVGFAF